MSSRAKLLYFLKNKSSIYSNRNAGLSACRTLVLVDRRMDQPIARSDELRELEGLLKSLGRLGKIIGAELVRVRAVVDSNIVLGDIGWLLGARQPDARTATQEAVDSGLLSAYAPEQMRTEVEAHLDEIAVQRGVSGEAAKRVWAAYSARIAFVPVDLSSDAAQRLAQNLRDPSDLPFLLAFEAIAADVLVSKDPDLAATGVPGVLPGIEIMLDLRAYCRAAAIELKVKITGFGLLTVSALTVGGLVLAVESLAKLFTRLPAWAKVLLLAGAIVPLLHGPTRARLGAWIERMKATAGEWWAQIQPHLVRWANEHAASTAVAATKSAAIRGAMPPRRRITLRAAVVAVLAKAKSPLQTVTVAEQVMTIGYRPRSERPDLRYLRRVLRSDDCVIEVKADHWAVRSTTATAGNPLRA
jgi:predicted nucleic acid-binding protein